MAGQSGSPTIRLGVVPLGGQYIYILGLGQGPT
jgi:hypothetical protein